MAKGPRMVEVRSAVPDLRRAYHFFSRLYPYLIAPLEIRSRRRAIELASISCGDQILEVAVGSGNAFLEMAIQKGSSKGVTGIDLTPGMIQVTRKRMARSGFPDVDIQEGDARNLPFKDNSFDLVFNSYMIDLIPLKEIDGVLAEYTRVLRPGGRLILVNMSKKNPEKSFWYEWIYQSVPAWFATFILGGCRPVVLESHVRTLGYQEVIREYYSFPMFCEIISGKKGK